MYLYKLILTLWIKVNKILKHLRELFLYVSLLGQECDFANLGSCHMSQFTEATRSRDSAKRNIMQSHLNGGHIIFFLWIVRHCFKKSHVPPNCGSYTQRSWLPPSCWWKFCIGLNDCCSRFCRMIFLESWISRRLSQLARRWPALTEVTVKLPPH